MRVVISLLFRHVILQEITEILISDARYQKTVKHQLQLQAALRPVPRSLSMISLCRNRVS